MNSSSIKKITKLILIFPVLWLTLPVSGQQTEIKGKIVDLQGNPVTGAEIISGLDQKITNDSGLFVINVPDLSSTVIIKAKNFQEREVALKGRSIIEVGLYEADFSSIYDRTVLPEGESSLNQVTKSISNLSFQNAWKASAETPEIYMQGRLAGLNTTIRSGDPGVGANLSLRGYSSMYTTNQPLIVVDGIIYDNANYGNPQINGFQYSPLSFIDIRDIENITVIKDAASIYGAKAANGVILITTNHAKDEATKIDFCAYSGVNASPKRYPIMNSEDYRVYLSDIYQSQGLSTEAIQALPFMNDDKQASGYYRNHNNTNWQKELFRNGINQNYYMKIAGGDNVAKYVLSIGYLKENGNITGNDMARFNSRFNTDILFSKKLSVNATFAFSNIKRNTFDQGIQKNNPLYMSLIKAPFFAPHVYSEEGKESPNLEPADALKVGNPLLENLQSTYSTNRFIGAADFKYKFTSWLSVNSLINLTNERAFDEVFMPKDGLVPDTLDKAIADRTSKRRTFKLSSLYNDSRLSINKSINRHSIHALLGARILSSRFDDLYAVSYNSGTDKMVGLQYGKSDTRKKGGDIGEWHSLTYYTSFNYNLNKKYFAGLTASLDGSSKFGKAAPDGIDLFDHKFGLFPSLSAGWLVSSENFMANLKFIELLKVRASYGIVGNDDIGYYTSYQLYEPLNVYGYQGLVRANIANPNLQWETMAKTNIGADMAFFNERLTASFDFFTNKTKDLLVLKPVESQTGFENYLVNNGSMKTTGYEIVVNSRILNNTIKWDVGFSVTSYKSKITSLNSNELYTEAGKGTILTAQGEPLGVFYGLKTEGIFTTEAEAVSSGLKRQFSNGDVKNFRAGDIRFKDLNGDGYIDDSDRTVIGNPSPDFTGMISNNIQWKNIALEAIITYSYGNETYNYLRSDLESMSNTNNQTLAVRNRWRTEGHITNIPRADYGDPMGNGDFSDRWIEDGSYICLKSLSLSYRLPVKKVLKSFSVFATGYNLLLLTKYLGYSPEFSASGSPFQQGIDYGLQPLSSSFIVGVRLGL